MEQSTSTSPRWNATTKLVIGLTLVAIFAGLLVKFQNILPPLIMSFLLVYLLYPAASFLKRKVRMNWTLAVTSIYLVIVLLLLGGLTLSGVELVNQVQNAVVMVQDSLDRIPELVDQIAHWRWQFGPFVLDMASVDLDGLSTQIIDTVQPMLGRTGQLLGTVASGAVNTLGWTAFVLLISFFILAESGGLGGGIMNVNIPGYKADMERMGKELGQIWNAFLRGQLILITLATVIYTVVLGMLGVRAAIGLAVMAGLARFLPYVGPAISWTVLALVAYFQEFKLFGLDAVFYTLLVLAIAWIIDGILDNIVSPRIMADALKVHPAAVMVAALIAANLLGLLGVVIAAPILATMQLLGRYILRKLFDLDPWEGLQDLPAPPPLRKQAREWIQNIRARLKFSKK
jgi:predicted PurR-regulated permease PerM